MRNSRNWECDTMTDYKVSKEYKTISQIAGPLVFVKKTEPVGYQEMVSVRLSDGTMKRGQVLDSSDDMEIGRAHV